jgi:hypothetical protein
MTRLWIVGSAGLICFASVAAQAAPMGSALGIARVPHDASTIEKAASRRCWVNAGKTHCAPARRAAPPRSAGLSYGQPRPEDLRPEDLPVGASEWWRAMEREGRGGFAPDS